MKENSYNADQHCGFRSTLPPKASHIIPRGNLPPVWEPLV